MLDHLGVEEDLSEVDLLDEQIVLVSQEGINLVTQNIIALFLITDVSLFISDMRLNFLDMRVLILKVCLVILFIF